jgi:hypothetical protein
MSGPNGIILCLGGGHAVWRAPDIRTIDHRGLHHQSGTSKCTSRSFQPRTGDYVRRRTELPCRPDGKTRCAVPRTGAIGGRTPHPAGVATQGRNGRG